MKKTAFITLLLITFYLSKPVFSQVAWQKITDHPEGQGIVGANADVVNGIAYFTFGRYQDFSNSNSMWAYDITANSWTQKASFPGVARYGASSFAINDSIYYISGSYGHSPYIDEFWVYSIKGDTWMEKSYPAEIRLWATTFTINNKGYVFGGRTISATVYVENNTLWEYDPDNNTWTQKASLPNSNLNRFVAAAFVINDKGYIMGGKTGETFYFNDTWEYDPAKDSWAQKASRLTENGTAAGTAFSLYRNNVMKGYYVLGINGSSTQPYTKTFYEYDQATDTWDTLLSPPFNGRTNTIAFTYKNIAYIGLGSSDYTVQKYEKDIWRLSLQGGFTNTDTLSIAGTVHAGNSVYKHRTVTVYNSTLHLPYSTLTDDEGKFTFYGLPPGGYMMSCTPNLGDKYYTTYYPNTSDSLRTHKFELGTSVSEVDLYMNAYSSDSTANQGSLSIYPNPFNNSLKIASRSSDEFLNKIQVTNVQGGSIQEIDFSAQETKFEIDMQKVAAGMYVLRVESSNNVYYYRVSKE